LTWLVTVAGLTTASKSMENITTSYAKPKIKASSYESPCLGAPARALTPAPRPRRESTSAVTGAGVSGASTSGGQKLIIAGIEFGPSSEDVPIVQYGPKGEEDKYTAEECELSVEFTQVTCVTAEGVGKDLDFQIVVGNQTSDVYIANMSYAAPTVAIYYPSWDESGDNGARSRPVHEPLLARAIGALMSLSTALREASG
jgi:hypothetical protein